MTVHDPLLEAIREDPEFIRIAERAEVEWRSFSA
jgi:hypothetical protein